jgi:predicted secreted protein
MDAMDETFKAAYSNNMDDWREALDELIKWHTAEHNRLQDLIAEFEDDIIESEHNINTNVLAKLGMEDKFDASKGNELDLI